MDTKNAENAHFWQVDHTVKQIAKSNQAVVLSSPEAWKKYPWSRKYFVTKPLEGYFVWIKENPGCPLFTCINLIGKNVKQNMSNVLVIEEGLHIDLSGFCGSVQLAANREHQAKGKIVLKKGVHLKYVHTHAWKTDDVVSPSYEFVLEEGVTFNYTYRLKQAPKIMDMHNTFVCEKNASLQFQVLADCQDSQVRLTDKIQLIGKGSKAITNLRFVARKNSTIEAISHVSANAASAGHVDCQSLMIDKKSSVSLRPEVQSSNKDAQLTHEASIGKISEEQITYLRMRGLTQDEAINLIVTGFLKL